MCSFYTLFHTVDCKKKIKFKAPLVKVFQKYEFLSNFSHDIKGLKRFSWKSILQNILAIRKKTLKMMNDVEKMVN